MSHHQRSSLFIDALALRPTKDNFFSTDHQGEGEKGIERHNRLQSLVSTLSTGPVFPADALNSSDVPLIMRSCMVDGRTLRPDRAATNVDRNIVAKTWAAEQALPSPGELQSTTSTVDGLVYGYVMAVQTSACTVSRAELFPPTDTTQSGAAPASTYLAFESNSTNQLHVFDDITPLPVSANDRWSFNFWTASPPLSNGYYFLGEADSKWIAVSKQRFTTIEPTAEGFEVTFVGSPNETVQLAWAAPLAPAGTDGAARASPARHTLSCTVNSTGQTTATFPAGVCQ